VIERETTGYEPFAQRERETTGYEPFDQRERERQQVTSPLPYTPSYSGLYNERTPPPPTPVVPASVSGLGFRVRRDDK